MKQILSKMNVLTHTGPRLRNGVNGSLGWLKMKMSSEEASQLNEERGL